MINITIQGVQAAVFDNNFGNVESQIIECYTLDFEKTAQELSKNSSLCMKAGSVKFLFFEISLAPMETKVYFVRHIFDKEDCQGQFKDACAIQAKETKIDESYQGEIENDLIRLELNNLFLPKRVEYLQEKKDDLEIIAELYEYTTRNSQSDFYVFQPNSEATKLSMNYFNAFKFEGPLMSQVSFYGSLISPTNSSKDNDLIEIHLTLLKGSNFPVITLKLKLNSFKEITLRFEVSDVMGGNTKLYFSDSMFFTEREHISLSETKPRNLLNFNLSKLLQNLTLNCRKFNKQLNFGS